MTTTHAVRVARGSDFPQWCLKMNAKQAWAVLAAGVLSYEIACREGQLLSEGVDEWLISRPFLTRAAIAAMALHLGNAVPKRYDVVSLGFQVLRQSSRYLVLVSAKLAS
ncbi:hypothetical protein A5630_15390 [Mycolicibacterium mucogenicum]|uniref:Uncharacterized protein n=1 Tax=Mycolicibacterium mucogenicum TaxID=56689 RepID=A0A1A3HB34_MYCMU|nr:hypothetical protein [Mycolicibacterium mucogenicum]OBJ44791.1 hypothetical protein A5630_15390 [Mycolicibacterium mucogenicum]